MGEKFTEKRGGGGIVDHRTRKNLGDKKEGFPKTVGGVEEHKLLQRKRALSTK